MAVHIKYFSHSYISTSNQLTNKLKGLCQDGNRSGYCLPDMPGVSAKEVVVATSHFVLLTDSGHIYRIPYSLASDGKEKSDDDGASTSSVLSGSRGGSPRLSEQESSQGFSSIAHRFSSLITRRGRLSGGGGGGGGGRRVMIDRRSSDRLGRALLTRSSVVPVSEIPEELIEEAMSVLQGKSRDVVVRELQRTNLDVNTAVNNLLSRDNDDDENNENDDAPSLIPTPGEDLLALLSSGSIAEEDFDEIMAIAGRGREEVLRGRHSSLYHDSLVAQEIRSWVTLADRAATGSSTSSGGVASGSGGGSGSKGKGPASSTSSHSGSKEGTAAVHFGTQSCWGDKDNAKVFIAIAATSSELLAVDDQGILYGWSWGAQAPPTTPHPRSTELGLNNERVKFISARVLRATVVTESGKIATWVDPLAAKCASALEHSAVYFPELSGENIVSLSTCELFSAVFTDSGRVYWWGVLPFLERKLSITQAQDRNRSTHTTTLGGGGGHRSSSGDLLHEGSQVCLRSRPIYSSGCRGIHIKGSTLKCGELQESVFSLSEKCRFKIITDFSSETNNNDVKLDLGPSLGSKRPHPSEEEEELEEAKRSQEEVWSLRDVVFLTPPLSSTPLGSVVKLDGLYAAVLFPTLSSVNDNSKEEEMGGGEGRSVLSQCRLLRKDDLVVVPSTGLQSDVPILQSTPKRIKLPTDSTVLALSTDMRGTLSCSNFSLETAKLSLSANFPEPSSRFLSLQLVPRPPLHPPPMKLISLGLSLWLLVDSSGGLYPLAKDSMGGMKQLPLLNLPPIQALTNTPFSSKQLLVAMVFQPQKLIPLLRQGNLHGLRDHLKSLSPPEIEHSLRERTHGGCNILHLIASLATPPRPTPPTERPRPGLREMMHHALHLASPGSEPRLWSVGIDGSEEEMEAESGGGDTQDKTTPLPLLNHLSPYFSLFHDTFIDLMLEINLTGFTPLMAAVACKGYSVALYLLELALSLTEGDEELLMSMIYPNTSHPDDNPLIMLCRNDPCSFTWSGEEHIQQDIFECRTCGLTGTLCCCTECAYTCHRGHDCTFKKASPSAYCDCWEKCSCHALAPGDDNARMALLHKLLMFPFLSSRRNNRGEYLLGMLTNTVARQRKEQSQWMGRKSNAGLRRTVPQSRYDHTPHSSSDVPVHNFSPPKFANRALMLILEDWVSVKSCLMCENKGEEVPTGNGGGGGGREGEWPQFLSQLERQRILSAQKQTNYLDSFTYIILTKTTHPIIETLVTTLVNQVGVERSDREAVLACQYFIRSVLRVLVICELEKTGSTETSSSSHLSNKKKTSDTEHSLVYKEAVFILNSLAPLSIPELVATARSLILPVCMGVARPFLPTLMNDKHRVSEDMFSLPPANLQRHTSKSPPVGGVIEVGSTVGVVNDNVSDSESDVGENEEVHTHGDASSTATVGSGIPFFSDQESSDGEDLDSVGEEGSLDGGDLEDETTYQFVGGAEGVTTSRVVGSTHWALPDSSNVRRFSRSSGRDSHSYSVTASLLTQSFSSLIRLITELQSVLNIDGPHPPFVLQPLPTDKEQIHSIIWGGLERVWVWLAAIMDSTEAQLRLGCVLNKNDMVDQPSSSSHSSLQTLQVVPSSSSRSSESPGLDSRRSFLGYLLSLMRSETDEHCGILPALDMGRMEHVAWVLDSLIYLLVHSSPPPPSSDNKDTNVKLFSEDQRQFFRRSNSTTCLSYPPPSPFAPLNETLPLAERPQLLHPKQSKEVLFGYNNQVILEVWPQTSLPPPHIYPLIKHPIPVQVGLHKALDKKSSDTIGGSSVLTMDQVSCESSHSLSACVLLGRWCMTVELLGRVHADTLGHQKFSIFSQLQGFDTLERDLRREMDYLRSSAHRDLQIEIERERERLLPELFRRLNDHCEFHRVSTNQQPLCVHRLRVSFRNEQGEGSGVVRSFFTALAEAVTSDSPLPELDHRLSHSVRPLSFVEVLDDLVSGPDEGAGDNTSSVGELSPLFHQPGKPGFYSIRLGTNTPSRLNAYRNIGRVIGLALLHSEMMPLPLCRHIYKYLLNKKVSWHDLAFFDPALYEGLRKLLVTAQNNEDHFNDLDLSSQVTLGEYEGGGTHSLLSPSSSSSITDRTVAPNEVYQYVCKYAELRMIRVIEEPLQSMKAGLYDVLPPNALEGLTAEDMRLLLCGCQQVELDVLKKITTFTDESRRSSDQISKFKSWFWNIVERMSNRERQDLLYFWTSSPAMPANPEAYQPAPSITFRPADDQHLPTSNTCISRLYLPMYSSKALLKAKLLAAIKIKTFGFI